MAFDETQPHFLKDTVSVDMLADGELFILRENVLFYSAELKQTLYAPEGFITDFASTPPFARDVFPKSGPWSRPAILHDAGYTLRLLTLDGQRRLLNKLEVDRLFLEGMIAAGVPPWKRTLMYWAVRAFGRGQFNDRRPEHLREV